MQAYQTLPPESDFANHTNYRHGMIPLADPRITRGVNTLTTIFGKLSVSIGGQAMFLRDAHDNSPLLPHDQDNFSTQFFVQQEKASPGYPVLFETIEHHLPPEDLATELINLFFNNIHPYVPVLNKANFCKDWASNRRTMSPYLLFSFFATAARYSDDPRVRSLNEDSDSRGNRWYDLVLLYRESFRDAPRLSTIQAEVLNLKAFETRSEVTGYFYRCWYLLGCIIRMGKDLGLHRMAEHPEEPADSITGRRVWQVCLIMDQLMGTAQGRELQMDMAEVDLTLLPDSSNPAHNLNPSEVSLQNDFVYMTGLMKILRKCTEVHDTVGIKFPFSAEPQYPQLSDTLAQWSIKLPKHLVFDPLVDKVLPSHFAANIQLAYHMIICALHRPWIVSVGEYGASGEWRHHLKTCRDAARKALALYELTLEQYGEAGLKWMIRGNNIAIYGASIMTMIHAICATCPEQAFNDGSRDQLNRSIAVLDRLSKSSPHVQLEKQIAAIRSIFSRPSIHSIPVLDMSDQYNPVLTSEKHQVRSRPQSFSHSGTTCRPSFDYRSSVSSAEQSVAPMSSSYPIAKQSSFFQGLPIAIPDTIGLNTSSKGLSSAVDSSPESAVMSPTVGTPWNPAGIMAGWTNPPFSAVPSGLDYSSQYLTQGNLLSTEHDATLIPTMQSDACYSHVQSTYQPSFSGAQQQIPHQPYQQHQSQYQQPLPHLQQQYHHHHQQTQQFHVQPQQQSSLSYEQMNDCGF